MKVSDLKSSKGQLGKEFNIPPKVMDYILELIEKGRIAKPIKLFKDCAPKLNVKGFKKFTYLDMGQKSYFLFGVKLLIGPEIKTELTKVKKEISKAKDKQKEILEKKEFFLEELNRIQPQIKGHASGFLSFAKSKNNICYMAVKSGVNVSGKTKKGTLADDIKNIGYDLTAKNGQIMQFIPIKEEKEKKQTSIEPTPNLSSSPKKVPQKKQDPQWKEKKFVIKTKMIKMKEQLERLQAKLG